MSKPGNRNLIGCSPNDDISPAHLFASGVDLWLNTPIPIKEASRTSDNKAVLNGVFPPSIQGRGLEMCIEGRTGREIGGMNAYFLTIIGLARLINAAEWMVRGSSALALRLHVRPLVIGLTVVAFGTRMPELTVSVQAALDGESGIALGNVIGSNICNLGLIPGVSAIIRPVVVHSQTVRLDIPVMIGASILSVLFIYDGTVSRLEGICLLIGMAVYLFYTLSVSRKDTVKIPASALGDPEIKHASWGRIGFQILVGLTGLIPGSRWFVNGGVDLAVQ